MKRLSHVLAALRSATMSLGTKTVKRVVPEIAAGLSKEGAMKLARLGAIFATAILVFGTPLMLKATSPDVIYYIDSNQNVDELRFNGSNWSTTNVTSATSATKASSTGGITGHLFGSSDNVWYIGKDQHVHELVYYGAPASWHTSDITSLAGATNANLNSP